MASSPGTEYLETVIKRLLYYKQLGDQTIDQLTDKDIHFSPNETSNSIAIIIQHLSGNMLSRWTNFLTEDGEKEGRKRDDEFEIHNYSRQQVIDLWEKGWACMLDTLRSLTENDLLKNVYIRKEPLTAIDAINRQLAHVPYHIGQMVYIGKIIKDNSWKNLSIEKGKSNEYNKQDSIKDPAKLMK